MAAAAAGIGAATQLPYSDGEFSVSNKGAVAFTGGGPDDLPEVYLKRDGKTQRLTNLNSGLFAEVSIGKLAALPGGTKVCCGHEYTESNARFALSVDPDNAALKARTEQAHQQRAAGQPTLPSIMSDELAANPFLRAPDVATFADLRAKKDKF